MKLKLAMGLAAAAAVAVFAVGPFNNVATAQMSENWKPKWTADGKLKLPEGFREWIFLGAPLTPHALNDGKAGFPEYHNVYIHPEAYKIYKATSEFPEGTILLKELQLTKKGEEKDGSRTETSGRGYFPAAFNGIDISVKDSKRFSETQNWGYFNFGHHAPPYAPTAAAAPAEACAACHIASATKDMVFTEFYTLLNTK